MNKDALKANRNRSLHLLGAVIFTALAGFSVLPSLATAETQAVETLHLPYGNRSEMSLDNAYRPPAVFVTTIEITSPRDSKAVKGRFLAVNRNDDIVADLGYKLSLLGPLPEEADESGLVQDNAHMYENTVVNANLALIPDEERWVKFNYQIPPVPTGEYRLQVTMTTSKGRDMGWADAKLNVSEGSSAYALSWAGKIVLADYPGESYEPLSGPNTSPGSKITLPFIVRNIGKDNLSAVPVLNVYSFGIAQDKVDTIELPAVSLAPQESKALEFVFAAPKQAGVFYAEGQLRTRNSQTASTISAYRWVVRGKDGDILSARIVNLSNKKGEAVRVAVDYAGSADAEIVSEGKLFIEVLDESGSAGQLEVSNVKLSDGINGGQGNIELQRDLEGAPRIAVKLFDSQGNLLDEYGYELILSEKALEMALAGRSTVSRIVIFIGSGLLLTALLLLARSRLRPRLRLTNN